MPELLEQTSQNSFEDIDNETIISRLLETKENLLSQLASLEEEKMKEATEDFKRFYSIKEKNLNDIILEIDGQLNKLRVTKGKAA